MKNRANISKIRSGGIIFAVSENLAESFKPVENSHASMLTIKIDKNWFGCDKHIIASIYFRPYGTRYSNVELFKEIDNKLLNYDQSDYYILLCGYFNSHTQYRDIVALHRNILRENDIFFYI